MSEKRWFPIVAVALAVLLVLTIQAGFATAQLAVAASSSSVCSVPAIRISTIHGELDGRLGMVVAHSEAGPTGVDGGLLGLLVQPPCSQ